MAVSLYTSRVVLNELGVIDFGVYNVVGGIVAMLAFLNGSMTLATQRYLAFDMGKNDTAHLRITFSTAFNIHLIIAVLTVILAETIGIWLFDNYINIPKSSWDAAKIVYHIAIIQTAISIISVPLTSLITASENMKTYAYISILEVLLKLVVAFMLIYISYHKLVLYAYLQLAASILVFLTWITYCNIAYPNCKYNLCWDKSLFGELLRFIGWQTLGSITWILRTQGVNILLNIYFGPILNTARGIAVQVNGAVMQFVNNFQMASHPQITKLYASNDIPPMINLILRSSRISFLLLFVLALPIIIKAENILKIWLDLVPPYSVIFVQLMLISTLFDLLSGTMLYGALATGKIKFYQSIMSSIMIFEIILTYTLYKIHFPPESVFYIEILLYIVALIARLLILKKLIGLSIRIYLKNVICKEVLVVGISVILLLLLQKLFPTDSIILLILFIVISCIICSTLSFRFGLSKDEREWVWLKGKAFFKKLKLS